MSVGIFGNSTPVGISAFVEPPPEDRKDLPKPISLVGQALLITVLGIEDVATKNYGIRPAVRVNVVTLEDGEGYTNQLIFSKAIVDALRGFVGQPAKVARVGSYTGKTGALAPKLVAPTEADIAAAKAVLAGA